MSTECIEKADMHLQTIESGDESTTELSTDIVANTIKCDQTNECIVDEIVKAFKCNDSNAACPKEILSTLSQKTEHIFPMSDISDQCLNTITLSNDRNHKFSGQSDLTDNEFIDTKTEQNIFNIYLSDGNTNALKSESKRNPVIQVLSESSSTDLLKTTDFEAINDLTANDKDCVVDADTTLEPIISFQSTECAFDKTVNELTVNETVNNFDEMNKEKSLPLPKSVITFYCESLDDLKETGSESEVDIEEI